ncbi:MAG TPA: YfiR family protein [Candidatus Acidoferrum sp.]|nr:YfiR family protein [Candidatus Acidoferrum sp.]
MNLFSKFRALFMVLLIGGLAEIAPAQTGQFSEYDVKAAFLYNFGKFVDWPANAFTSPDAPMIIGVYGENPFHDHLADIVRGKSIRGHVVVVEPVTFNTLQNCQILFISASEQKNLTTIVRKLDGASVLTVTENSDPFASGVMINFVMQNDQIRFEINDAAARQAGLKISSKLLVLATKTKVSRETPKKQPLLCTRSP